MSNRSVFCSVCEISVPSRAFSAHLRSTAHKNNNSIYNIEGIEKIGSAFRSRIAAYRVRESQDDLDCASPPFQFLRNIRARVRHILEARQSVFSSVKVNFELFAEFSLLKNDTCDIKSFATQNIIIHPNFDFNEIFLNVLQTICRKIDEFQTKDSGWSFMKNLYLEINICKYNPLRASGFIDLPKSMKLKRACINIKNNDAFCFLWCVMAYLFPAKNNVQIVSSYPHYENVLNIKNMTFPVGLNDIKIFEKNNQHISVNVYSINNKSEIVGPLYKTACRRQHHVNLLMLENGRQTHYCLIKNLGRLLKRQLTKHKGKFFLCEECMIFFNSETKRNAHVCGGVKTVLPNQNEEIKFQNFERMQDMPFVIYADFESLLVPNTNEKTGLENTIQIQMHVPAAFAYYVVCSYDSSLNKFVTYRGEDCVAKFLEYLQRDISTINNIYSNPKPMVITETEEKDFLNAHHCFLCGNLLLGDSVRDHSHVTGKFRGASHSYCNLRFRLPEFVPVFFHNLSGYDSHLFLRELGEMPGQIKVIAKNKENYISFTKYFIKNRDQVMPVRFVDSFKFLGASLGELVSTLDDKDFVHLAHFYPLKMHFDLLKRKGIYPYEYMNNWNRYEEQCLPQQHNFYSSLTDEIISKYDYEHAKLVWKSFGLENLGDYTDLYLKSDVLLLADIFEKFRQTCKVNYRLDPAFYLTAPSLSFDAMLRITNVKLQLINDLEIVRMIQKGIRGGVCLCSTRYVKANNKYMPDYDPSIPNNFLLYIDCNNLYGYAMCASLPYGDFELLQQGEINELDVRLVPDDSDFGYILEVDLQYPEYLHDLHNDIPFCPQKFIPPGSKQPKLIPNLYDKYEYVIHYVHLKTCLKHGLVLKKIHRVIKFKQGPFLKQYIDLNTRLRQKATSVFEQNLFKLFNNAIFGKTLEDPEKRLKVMLVNIWNDTKNKTKKKYGAECLISRPNYHSSTIFSENFVAVQMKPESVKLDRPIYIGFTVLEISKSHMYNFHYSSMKTYYGPNITLCYMDTDSYLYSITTEDVYADIKLNFQHYFDTSNYPTNNLYGISRQHNKVPGLFKDELGGEIIREFVGLRSKLYCIKTEKKQLKKAKGTKKHVLRHLDFENYKKVLLNNERLRKTNIVFKSLKHVIFTQSVKKVALSSNDDKRVLLNDRISTLSWGHESMF